MGGLWEEERRRLRPRPSRGYDCGEVMEARGIACDHADGLCTVKNIVEDLVTDQAGGSCDDNHENHLQVGLREGAWTLTSTL
ncbi:hypothetical protein [Ktedonospora formicarum]|uniref:Uncharacterized protein n=1 Tax=Ktedonospora formicarum TaxID=2778364 RepID=A0A8J3MWC3_9CHLR|nr:hypothetical protein [Ktedonospora formicarum]GHO51282.1 hypothetical protein KSX_94450 [Ktedonospora formicarum]